MALELRIENARARSRMRTKETLARSGPGRFHAAGSDKTLWDSFGRRMAHVVGYVKKDDVVLVVTACCSLDGSTALLVLTSEGTLGWVDLPWP